MLRFANAGSIPRATGAYDKTCDPHPEVIERMVQWGQTRQRAFDDAIAATPSTVRLLFYIEFNHGAKALEGKVGQLNSVIERVNPDLVSYSAYVSTNACERALRHPNQYSAVKGHNSLPPPPSRVRHRSEHGPRRTHR